jgi:YtkA-like
MTIRCKTAAVAAAMTLWGFAPAFAEVKDYEFQLVQNEAKKGEATIAVRLLNKKTGKTVPDAVISAKRIDMAPDGMADMQSPVNPLPGKEPGVYAFKTDLPMAGRYLFSIAAKVQGEPETVVGKVVFTALK